MRNLTKKEIEQVLTNDTWNLGNQVLYDLCSKHPHHKTAHEIIAKVWLIGRAYAAAIERRKNKKSDSTGDLFYEHKVVPKIRGSEIDSWIASLKDNSRAEEAIDAHSRLTNLFYEISELDKRSLASKYLHFHRPDLFYIYDSRAVRAIRQVTPTDAKQLPRLSPIGRDEEYLRFYKRCLWFSDDLKSKLGRKTSPREIDTILLHVADGLI